MPTISSFYGILIQMYWNDHAPPHFHVRYSGFKATVAIQSLAMLTGHLPRTAERLVLGVGDRAPGRTHGGLEIMRDQSATVSDRTAAVIPPVLCSHPDDVAEVRAESGFCLHVKFFDGTQGIVDLHPLIHSSDAGVFAALADEAVFSLATVEFGAVTWPNGLDLAPDAMYSALRESGHWIPR